MARNCTLISPCQQDTGIIRQAEIDQNIVNTCGRTELAGNIDIGQVTEDQIAAKAVTQVTKGGSLIMTIHQVNADGAGPYTCDLDETSNAGAFKGNLTVTNNVPGANGLSQVKEQDFNITIAMPTDMACIGGSTGNICTVRCRNNSVAGPFGGCVAVEQTDITPAQLQASTIKTAATLKGMQAQVISDNTDLQAAVVANENTGAPSMVAAMAAVSKLLKQTQVLKAAPVQTLASNIGSLANPDVPAAAPAVTVSQAHTINPHYLDKCRKYDCNND